MTPYRRITTDVTDCMSKEINYVQIKGKGKVFRLVQVQVQVQVQV